MWWVPLAVMGGQLLMNQQNQSRADARTEQMLGPQMAMANQSIRDRQLAEFYTEAALKGRESDYYKGVQGQEKQAQMDAFLRGLQAFSNLEDKKMARGVRTMANRERRDESRSAAIANAYRQSDINSRRFAFEALMKAAGRPSSPFPDMGSSLAASLGSMDAQNALMMNAIGAGGKAFGAWWDKRQDPSASAAMEYGGPTGYDGAWGNYSSGPTGAWGPGTGYDYAGWDQW